MVKLPDDVKEWLPLAGSVGGGFLWWTWWNPDVEIWGWAETNQGLLSVVALVFALTFALVENHRANNASRDRRAEYVDLVLALIDEMETEDAKLHRAIDAAQANGDFPDGQRFEWRRTRARLDGTLSLIRTSAPLDAPLAIAMTDLHDWFGNYSEGGSSADARRTLAKLQARLEPIKARIASRR